MPQRLFFPAAQPSRSIRAYFQSLKWRWMLSQSVNELLDIILIFCQPSSDAIFDHTTLQFIPRIHPTKLPSNGCLRSIRSGPCVLSNVKLHSSLPPCIELRLCSTLHSFSSSSQTQPTPIHSVARPPQVAFWGSELRCSAGGGRSSSSCEMREIEVEEFIYHYVSVF